MVDNTKIEISTNLKETLEKMATEKNTDIDNIIKLTLEENKQLRKNPERSLATTKVSSKDNKNKKGEVTSQTHSTVIPKPIISKLGLETKQLLYWDIDDNKIIITPEVQTVPTPEEESIQAGTEMLNDMLFNNNSRYYLPALERITQTLKSNDLNTESKVNDLVKYYNNIHSKESTKGFTQVLLYLLDYPLNLPNQYEILREVYDEITKD